MVSTELILPPREPIRVYGGKHPLTNEHRQVEVRAGATIAEALEMSLASTGVEWPFERFVATVNDVRVPREHWDRVRPKPGTMVVFRPVASGDQALRSLLFLGVAIAAMFIAPFIAGPALLGLTGAALTAGTAIIGGAITIGGALLLNALIPIRPPALDSTQPKTLPMISGASNEVRPWGAIPVVLGRHRLSPMFASMPYSHFTGAKQYMTLLFCCGYGRVKMSDLRIGETKIGRFEEIDLEIDEGNNNENTISIFKRSVDEQPLSITLKSTDQFVGRTTNSKSCRVLSIDLIAANGIWQFNKSNGKYVDRPVTVNVQYRKSAIPGVRAAGAWIARPNVVFHLNRDTFRMGDQWKVAVDQYDVQVRKVTVDYKGPEQVADTIVWQTLRAFENTVPIKFPKPLALVCMEARGSDQFNGVISTFNCVVESYVKHWNGSAWVANTLSSNPGDLFLHVLQGPANARPRTDAQVDFDSIQLWAEDCTARGYTYNSVVTDQRTVREVLGDIAAAGRATVALRNGKWGVSFPRDQDAVSWHFTPRNSSGFKTQRTYRELPHALRVRWINATGNKNWRQEEGIVYNDTPDGSGPNGMYVEATAKLFETVEFPGITNWNHVHKAARYQLAQALLRPETHTLTADVESLRLERGDKVIMSTDTLLIGTGYGRATKVDGASQVVTVDSRVIMETGKSYQVKFTMPDGSFLTRSVLNTANETDLLRLDAADVPPLQSLQSIIVTQDLTVGLKLLLEAGNIWSWPGHGNKWLDESGGGDDFFLGVDGTVSDTEPFFAGVPGAQTVQEFWAFGGATGFFTLAPINRNWINLLHQDKAKGTGLFVFYLNALGLTQWLCGDFANATTKVGFEFVVQTSNTLLFRVGNGSGTYHYNATSVAMIATGWHIGAFSIDEGASPTGTCTLMIDGNITTVAANFAAPSTAVATHQLQIAGAGGNAGYNPAGFRLRSVAFWQGVALTGPQLLAIRDAILATNDLLPPVGALFSFGERTKVTNTYRVLDVRPGGDLSAQFVLVDDANIHDQYDQEPVPEYDSAISEQPDPFSMVPKGLTYAEFFSGSGITAKATIQLTVQITRVGTIRVFEFQYRDITTHGIRPMVPVFDPVTGLPVLDPVTGEQVKKQIENDGNWFPFATVNAPYLTATKDNLEAGNYEFRVRALYVDDGIASTNDSSSWVYATTSSGSTSIEVLSTDSPPPSLAGGIRVNIHGNVLILEWDASGAINVALYRVKYNPATDGSATWGNSNVLLNTTDTRATTATLSGTYMVKTVSYSGIEADEELEHIVVTSPPTPPNILEIFSEAPYEKPDHTPIGPSFPGYHSSTQKQGELLTLAFAPSGGNYITGTGFYRFFQYIDLGSVYTSRITASVSASGISSGDTMDHWTSLSAVTALDTTDPSQWSIDMQYAASDGPTGKKSVIQRITDLGLTANLKLVLESANSASWPGTGQKWLDVTPGTGHYDFFLGLDATVSATNDPIFTGIVPSPATPDGTLLRGNAYWRFDGGTRYFTYDAVNETWMDAIHKDGAKFSIVVSFYTPTVDAAAANIPHYLAGDTAAPGQIGFQLYIINNKLTFITTNGSAVNYSVQSTLAIAAAGWHTVGISIVEATGTDPGSCTFTLDNASQTIPAVSYPSPNAGAASLKLGLASVGNGNGPLTAGWIMHAVCMWQGTALSAVDLGKITSGIHNNDNWVFGPWTSFSVGDVTGRILIFGISLKGSPDGSISPAVSRLGVTIDMPDRHLGFDVNDHASPIPHGSGQAPYKIDFFPPFKKLKSIAISNYDLDPGSGEKYVLTGASESGVTITFYKNGTAIDKTFSLHAYGYGSVIYS